MRALDPSHYERALWSQLIACLDEIESAMLKTMKRTQLRRTALMQKIATRTTPASYLDGDNSEYFSYYDDQIQ